MAAQPSPKLKTVERTLSIVHQALHGYAGGHRLLESSCPLPLAAERQLDVLSDLSASAPPSGFEEYLTLYPLNGMQAVALAKTWLAKEMPRPGCVWTHTLIIEYSLLWNSSRLPDFTTLFVRPDKKSGFADYTDPLPLPAKEFVRDVGEEIGKLYALAQALVRHWYSAEGRKPLVIPAESSQSYQRLLLSFWEQQTPSMRTSLSISTGSIADRRVAGRSFDIQVVPRSNMREVLRQSRGINLEESELSPPAADGGRDAVGQQILTRDLQAPSIELRNFLRSVANTPVALPEIPIFVEAFSVWFGPLELSEKINRLWDLISAAFPEKLQGANLKSFFFGNRSGVLKGEAEQLMLRALLVKEHPTDFLDSSTLRLPSRCVALAQSDLAAAMSLLESVSRSHHASELLIESFNALLDSMPPPTLLQFLESNRPLVRDTLRRRPELISESGFWDVAGDSRHEVIAALAMAPSFSARLAESLIDFLTRSESPYLVETFLDRSSDANLEVFLQVALKSAQVSTDLFERLLRRRPEVLFAMGASQTQLPGRFLLATSRVVSTRWAGNSSFPFCAWAASLGELNVLTYEETIRVKAYSTAMALAWKTPTAVDFLRASFGPVYTEAKSNRIDYQSWALLDPLLPSLWGWGNWDKCERLRRAILENMVQGIWKPAILLVIVREAETLSAFIKTAGELGYQKLFPAFRQSVDEAAGMLSDQERRTLKGELLR